VKSGSGAVAADGLRAARPTVWAVQRWTPLSVASVSALALLAVVLAGGPWFLGAHAIDRLTTLFIYVILASMWNALAGYGGLVSVGQQAFFGLGAYAAIRLSSLGVPVYPALLLGAAGAGLVALALSPFALRLRGGEFAIGMWVLAELFHLLVNLDPLIQGETGTSLIALNAFAPQNRRDDNYWLALASMLGLGVLMFALLRGRLGGAVQAIRDSEEAAASLGVRVLGVKRVLFVVAGAGCGLAGALEIANTISFQPATYFGVQWTAYMIFMALVGGLGTIEGPIIGALVFFTMESLFGATGVWYLVGLGATAVVFALYLPRGLWGRVEQRFGLRLLPVGYRVELGADGRKGAAESQLPS
jgi:branched-chain amino acid transport system permease protein